MSRNPVHRKRRIWWLYVPVVVIATIVYFYSYAFTITLNVLGFVAMLVAFAAMAAITKERTNDWDNYERGEKEW